MDDLLLQNPEEQFADSAITLFLDEAAEADGKQLLETFKAQESVMPETLDRKCHKLLHHTFSKAHKRTLMSRTAKRAARAAACFAIAATLSLPLILSVEAFRIPILNFFLEHHNRETTIHILGESDEQSPSTLSNLVDTVCGGLPKGYELIRDNISTSNVNGEEKLESALFLFRNPKDFLLEIAVFASGGTLSIDTEDAELAEMTINGHQALFVKKDFLRALWTNEDAGLMFSVTSYGGMDEDDFWHYVWGLASHNANAYTVFPDETTP